MHAHFNLHEQTLLLLPQRAIFWVERKTLLVADAHFGKGASFRAGGVPVPRGTTLANLERLSSMIEQWQAQALIFLGDFLHARAAQHDATLMNALMQWRRQHADLKCVLVRGNHDDRAGDPPVALDIEVVDEPYRFGPFALCHHPDPVAHSYVLAGHIHPGYRLKGLANDSVHVPCFWFGAQVAVLPAFGAFTGTWTVMPQAGEHIFLVANDTVHAVPVPCVAARSDSDAFAWIPGSQAVTPKSITQPKVKDGTNKSGKC